MKRKYLKAEVAQRKDPSLIAQTFKLISNVKIQDAAASAGAYFAFVQFLSWIVSGQVWAT